MRAPPFLAVLLLTYSVFANADVIRVPIAQQGSNIDHIERPPKGASKTGVLAQFGEPQRRVAARGEPPISSWQYAEFTVYFEHEHVIHSVLKHRPKNLPAANPEHEPDTD